MKKSGQNRPVKPVKPLENGDTLISADYLLWLESLKKEIQAARTRAALTVNTELIHLYHKIGSDILQRQQTHRWGDKIIRRLAADLKDAFPDMKGFSERNLNYMRYFAEQSQTDLIVQQVAAQIDSKSKNLIVQQLAAQIDPKSTALIGQHSAAQIDPKSKNLIVQHAAAQIDPKSTNPIGQPSADRIDQKPAILIGQQRADQLPWFHIITILTKIQPENRGWYAAQAVAEGWSRSTLERNIASRLHERQGAAVSNFAKRLPAPQSALAQETLKDPYLFDFLGLADDAHEREIENALIRHISKFLLELGVGFAFVGRQFRLEVGGDEFFIDLLFYHTRLKCYVVIELKATAFKPEYTGKLNFYLSAVDEQIKAPDDHATIGLLLCKGRNKIVAEYALRNVNSPIGVAEYELVASLPKELKTALPSIEEIEARLAESAEFTVRKGKGEQRKPAKARASNNKR